ncbi:uncharacterized protein LOC122043756 [Zingiber officinale]|uniref:uncharacterized protein LOC122043756 n=1 Tax=Zingiber officinale TaxID=94328 RepID=UPI001C4CBF75|nr:uncharacterized protein LOC122043756 [Zingiber officinale]
MARTLGSKGSRGEHRKNLSGKILPSPIASPRRRIPSLLITLRRCHRRVSLSLSREPLPAGSPLVSSQRATAACSLSLTLAGLFSPHKHQPNLSSSRVASAPSAEFLFHSSPHGFPQPHPATSSSREQQAADPLLAEDVD